MTKTKKKLVAKRPVKKAVKPKPEFSISLWCWGWRDSSGKDWYEWYLSKKTAIADLRSFRGRLRESTMTAPVEKKNAGSNRTSLVLDYLLSNKGSRNSDVIKHLKKKYGLGVSDSLVRTVKIHCGEVIRNWDGPAELIGTIRTWGPDHHSFNSKDELLEVMRSFTSRPEGLPFKDEDYEEDA